MQHIKVCVKGYLSPPPAIPASSFYLQYANWRPGNETILVLVSPNTTATDAVTYTNTIVNYGQQELFRVGEYCYDNNKHASCIMTLASLETIFSVLNTQIQGFCDQVTIIHIRLINIQQHPGFRKRN